MILGISIVIVWVDVESIYNSIGGEEFAKKIPKSLFIIPAGIILGIMLGTFVNYFIIYFLDMINQNNDINYPIGISLTFMLGLILTAFNIKIIKKTNKTEKNYEKKDIIYYSIVCTIVTLLVGFIMIYCFRTKENELLMGFGVYGDLVIHSAITSSFGVGGNIPTSYAYFSGDGINWHFFFYFLAGILNYLGINIVLSINILSVLTMECTLVLLGLLASLLSRNKLAFAIAPILVIFRSAFNIFYDIKNIIDSNKSILYEIIHNSEWSNVAPYDSWGFWTLNIYTNQRHFMLGMAVILILIILFLPYVIDM